MPDLSIVIPIYNTEEEYLRPCLASVEACAREGVSLEAILVDDGSKPAYGEMLSGIVSDYDMPVILRRKENGGQNSARSLGASLATGDYILFLDSDDRLVPSELARVLDVALEGRPKILCFNYDRVSPDGSLLAHCGPWRGGYRKSESLSGHISESDSLVRQLYCRKSFAESGVSLVEGPRIGEDMASAVALLLAIGEASSIEAAPYLYVSRPSSALHAVPKDRVFDILDAADGMLERVSPVNRSRFADELEALCIEHVIFWGGVRIVGILGPDEGARRRILGWMDERFPRWRENPCLGALSARHGLPFDLAVRGRWRVLAAIMRVKDVARKLLRPSRHVGGLSNEGAVRHEPRLGVRR